jgi:type IV pilus assembly protein PilB
MNDIALSGLAKQLVQAELLTEKSAQQAWQQAQRNRLSLVSYLVQNKLVKSSQVAEIASEHFGMAFMDLNCLDKETQPKGLVSEKLVRQHHALPLWRRGNKLFVGISDPSNHQAINDIQFSTGLSTEAILVEDDKLTEAIEKFFDTHASGLEDMADVDLDGVDVESVDDSRQDAIGGLDADDAPVVRFVHKMLLDAIKSGSSDLHFEPYEKLPGAGAHRRHPARGGQTADPVGRADRRTPEGHGQPRYLGAPQTAGRADQDAPVEDQVDRLPGQHLPTLWGEKVVIRILDPSSAQIGIDALGYEPAQKDLYMAALKQPQGMILVTGPTGSGKTVSLYTGLNILNTVDINISTAEDPVEINMEGINQVNVNRNRVWILPRPCVRSAAGPGRDHGRRDPRPGNCRNRDQGRTDRPPGAVHAAHQQRRRNPDPPAQHGHSRVQHRHLGEPDHRPAPGAQAVQPLQETDRNPPRNAGQGRFPPEQIGNFTIYEPVGCDHCNGGYKGRVGIYEVVKNTSELQRLIMAEGNSLEIDSQMRRDGFDDLRTSGLHKAMQGITSLEEINRVTKD